jgi:TonB family protein
MELAPLTVLNQRYTVKRTLGDPGPFDISYLGQDVDSDEEYIIREYFPAHLARRGEEKTSVEVADGEEADLFDSGLEYFQKESEVLAGLDHEALPGSYDTFEANGTFYRVRPHPPSMSLAKGLQDKGQLSEKAALTIMMPILQALQTAHENGLYHAGVSPRTIRLLEGGKVLLTGFRGAFFQLARETGKMSDLVQPGTSPVEQYTPRGQQGPWTDVYAAAATICQMVTGETLPESTDRLEGDDSLSALVQDADVFSAPGVREALVDALAVDPSQRLQSVEALINALKESSTRYDEDESSYSIIPVEPETGEEDLQEEGEVEVLSTRAEGDRPARSGSGARSESSNKTALMIGIPVLVLAIGGGAWFMMSSGSASSAASGSYQEYRSRADSLFENQNYETAEFLYNQALEIRSDDEYVQQRLEKLEQIQQQSSSERYQQFLTRGNALKAEADSLYQAGALSGALSRYSRAMSAYYSAQDANPDGQEAQQQMSAIQSRQTTIAKQQAGDGGGNTSINEIAEFFRKRGDRQLKAGNLEAALDKYQQAFEYSPDDSQLEQAISDLKQQIQQEEKEQKFQKFFNEGQQHLREQKYGEAKADFQNAAEVKPDDPRLRDALAEADSLAQVQQQRTAQYEKYRAQGDSLYDAGSFKEAIASYKNALEIRSDDDYVKSRIEQANRELEEMRLAQQEMQEQEQKRKEIVDENGVYKVVDQAPQVKGGLASLTQRASYPQEAREQGLQGRVYIQAIVNPDGTVRRAKVVRGLGKALDDEALEVVEDAEFVPGKYNGEAVPAKKTVWIQFQLEQ